MYCYNEQQRDSNSSDYNSYNTDLAQFDNIFYYKTANTLFPAPQPVESSKFDNHKSDKSNYSYKRRDKSKCNHY